jgi:hypothetical protein
MQRSALAECGPTLLEPPMIFCAGFGPYRQNPFSEETTMTAVSADRPSLSREPLSVPPSTSGVGTPQPASRAIWTGRILTGIGVLFLAFDLSLKLLQVPMALQGTTELGYATSIVLPLGIVELICLIAYLVPQTSVLGAILWTGYLGGAIATHVRLQNPLFTHELFPIYIAVLLWLGLWLREPRLRTVLPLKGRA